jgi:small-conductance mechanosensitive channel
MVLFSLLDAWLRSHLASRRTVVIPGDDEQEQVPASRLSTVVPLLRGCLFLATIGPGIMVALADLGVDITPLLAGAGIFGLALGFGAQSLVRDVVAGLFYLADDAFRVGEYIQSGQVRGTVESISLRSVRLRASNGHIHTVPFGLLGAVTNASRDYLTVKFTLKLARDVDLELVRKAAKRVGQDLLADPEYGPEFIQPLKMQGITDVQESAIIVRFKFTIKPGKPTVLQRESLKRLFLAFADRRIPFARNSVFVEGQPALGPAAFAAEQAAS